MKEHPIPIKTAANITQIFAVLPVAGISELAELSESTARLLVVLFSLPVSGFAMVPPSLPAPGLV